MCERRETREREYYLTNYPARTSRLELLRAIKARWSCEQAHQQLEEELGLDHVEGRSWLGLHHYALLIMIGFAFLQHRQLKAARTAAQDARHRDRRRAGGQNRDPTSTSRRSCPIHRHNHPCRPCVVHYSRRSTPSRTCDVPAVMLNYRYRSVKEPGRIVQLAATCSVWTN